jgi:GT2 family glycosyltransferase
MVATRMSNLAPLVSVCIANYNGMDVIDDCLRSVQAQQGNITVEILVHDDASSDGSLDYIRNHYPQVKVIASQDNVGFCIANNRMAAAATGKYLLLLNNDAALFQGALQALHAEAQRLAKPAILTLPQFDATSGQLIDRGCLLDPFFNPVPNLDPKRSDVAMVIGACLWIPKELWEEMEGFPEWFGSIAEDMYLCCRARLAGYTVRALAVSGYRHWQGKSFGGNRVVGNRLSSTFRRRALSERNKSFVMVLTYPAPMFYGLFPLHIALLLVEGAALVLLKREWAPFQEIYIAAVQGLWHKREYLRQQRQYLQEQRHMGRWRFFAVFRWFPYKLRMLLKYGVPQIR